MSNWLKRLLIRRVALVDKGSNPLAQIVLWKRKAEGEKMVESREVDIPAISPVRPRD